MKLLHPGKRHVRSVLPMITGHEVRVDLAAAEKQPGYVLGEGGGLRIADYRLEAALCQILQPGLRQRVAEQALGAHHDQRTSVTAEAECLPTQEVEVLPRRGADGNAKISLSGELKESLESRAGMFRPLPLVSVGKQ